jgi:hypothetical protein
MVKDLLLSVHDGLALHISLVVLLMNLHIHTEDVLLKPRKLLEFPSSGPGSSRLSMGWSIGASIPHKSVRVSNMTSGGSNSRPLPLDVQPLHFVIFICRQLRIIQHMVDEQHDVGGDGV